MIQLKRASRWSMVFLIAIVSCGCDAEGAEDGGVAADSGTPDPDAGPSDAGPRDVDAGSDDAGSDDAGPTDAGPTDAGPTDAGPPDAGALPTECSTAITAAEGGEFVRLCEIDGPARHIRIEGVMTPRTHASAQVVFGFDTAPASATEELGPAQARVLFYGGGTPFPGPAAQVGFGPITETLGVDASFLHATSTVCFDLHDGSSTEAPAFALWIDGLNGADCSDLGTLTVDSAADLRASWRGAAGEVDKTQPLFFRQTGGLTATPTVTVSETPALAASEIEAASACTSSWTNDTDWQGLCEPTGGGRGFIRVDGIQTTANNSYYYVVLGEAASPAGAPVAGAGKLILTGGQSHTGASWTWFRFGESGSTTQFEYEASGALYSSGPTTVCLDVAEDDGGAVSVLFWATGAGGADCTDHTTLTAANALYSSADDGDTGAIWDGPLATDLAFIKTNNGTVAAGDIYVSREPAVL